ncbi:MAG: putative intracellular protease/amidase, partial [Natronomonas sp.]
MSLSHAGVLVYEGFEPLDAVGPYELLSVGADRLAGADAGDSFET